MSDTNLSAFIWSVADLLRGDYKQSEYGKVILPFTVLRRLDCVLEPTKAAVLEERSSREQMGLFPEPFLLRKSGQLFFNTSQLDLKKLMGDQDHIAENLRAYLQGFSVAVRDIFDHFEFHLQIDRLDKAGLLRNDFAVVVNAIQEIAQGEGRLLELQATLSDNLRVIHETRQIEDAVHGLTGAIHLLTARSSDGRRTAA